jgi:predicted permease
MPLPRPRSLARRILRHTQQADARAFEADLAEVTARRGGLGAWVRAWWEILATLAPGRRAPVARAGPGGGASGVGRAGSLHPLLALRLALRGLRRDSATAFTAVLILSLGVAAPTVFFSILWGVGYRTLPVPDGDRIVRLEVTQPAGPGRVARVTPLDAELLRDLPELEGVGVYTTGEVAIGGSDGPARRFPVADLDPEAFELLGVAPARGRAGDPDEGPTWLAGEEAWTGLEEMLGLDLGAPLRIDGVPHATTGVMPESFGFPTNHHGWRIVEPDPDDEVQVVARLARGVSEQEATLAVARVWARADAGRVAEARGATARMVGFTKERGEGGEVLLFTGLVVVGLALLAIAIANASNLLLVRSIDRSRSLAIQGALGAGRGQLALQTLLESLMLAAAGGLGGFGLAAFGARYVESALGPRNFGFHWIEVGMTPAVAAFTLLLVLGTAVLAGTLPVLRLWKTDLRGLTGSGGRATPGSGRVGSALVSLQLGLSCAALVGAGLMVRTTVDARSFGRTLPSEEVALVNLSLNADEPDALARLRTRLETVRGGTVELATGAPGYFERATSVRLPSEDGPTGHASNVIGPRFLEMFGIDLLRGRALGSVQGEAPVALVSRSWVERFMPGRDPLGATVEATDLFGETPVTIVGIVEDVPLTTSPQARLDRIYFAFDQVRPTEALLLARAPDPGVPLGEVRSALGEDIATLGVPITLEEGLRFMTRVQETFGWLVVIGGISGFVVATVGLYGLLSFRIRQRRREFGIRLALGADGAAVTRSVLVVALRQIVPGIVLGAGIAWLASPVLGMLALGQNPRAPETYLAVGAVFLGTAMVAAWIPARRAARVDPVQTLKAE